MKKSLQWILCLGVCAATSTAFTQPDYGTPSASDTNQMTTTRETHSQNFCRSKDLVGAKVKDAQGNKLGSIDELMINPKNGETFASIGVSNRRYALVPIQALTVDRPGGMLRNAEVSLNATKESVESGPLITRNEWNNLDNSTFVQSIYSHYNVQQPSATGGAGSMGGTSSGAGSSQSNSIPQQQP